MQSIESYEVSDTLKDWEIIDIWKPSVAQILTAWNERNISKVEKRWTIYSLWEESLIEKAYKWLSSLFCTASRSNSRMSVESDKITDIYVYMIFLNHILRSLRCSWSWREVQIVSINNHRFTRVVGYLYMESCWYHV